MSQRHFDSGKGGTGQIFLKEESCGPLIDSQGVVGSLEFYEEIKNRDQILSAKLLVSQLDGNFLAHLLLL